MKKINITITGALGRMGKILIKRISKNKNLKLFSLTDLKSGKKINGIKKLMEETGAKKYTENLIENYYKKSIKNLSSIEISDGRKMPLLEMAKYLKERDK